MKRHRAAVNGAVRLAEAVDAIKKLDRELKHFKCPEESRPGPEFVDELPLAHLGRYFEASKRGRDYREQRQLLREVEACPECARAYEAVQERKVWRRRRAARVAGLVRTGQAEIRSREEERDHG